MGSSRRTAPPLPPGPPPRRCPPCRRRAAADAALGDGARGAGAGPPLGLDPADPPAADRPAAPPAALPRAPRGRPGTPRRPDRPVPTLPQAALLEPKRSLAVGIFLQQIKRPIHQIVQDIQEGVGVPEGQRSCWSCPECCSVLQR
ncbi:nascent polypeptide-associated complex subunit alpha, muscle-specific form-like [Falco biarmicus]|uniref:nascent polypeptide-associated complex subunit alpha, muscle-specific form-like n=1 Tax=Falco peregrinus TaxID=8954 RepID=UPI00247956B3|nr:nascent polypeptide-associated complex subunit alpha, muscle-specific form-like [Falco peregrinus]XP_056185953.1 nascent polypeptide-associated complex subunit alpha, muscle-specific form-like [Falco biarmicus]